MTFNGRNRKKGILLASSVGKGSFVNFRPLGYDSLNRRIKISSSRPFAMYKIMLKRSVRLPDERPEFNQGGTTEGQMLYVLLDPSLSHDSLGCCTNDTNTTL